MTELGIGPIDPSPAELRLRSGRMLPRMPPGHMGSGDKKTGGMPHAARPHLVLRELLVERLARRFHSDLTGIKHGEPLSVGAAGQNGPSALGAVEAKDLAGV